MASANAPARNPAFSRVLYVTENSTDQWFIPTTGFGDNPNSGTMAERLAACEELVGNFAGTTDDVGVAVEPHTLTPYS